MLLLYCCRYGRTLEYYLYSRGVTQVYSNLRRLKEDLARQRPNMFISVPLMLDNLQRTVGGRDNGGGGGSTAASCVQAQAAHLQAASCLQAMRYVRPGLPDPLFFP